MAEKKVFYLGKKMTMDEATALMVRHLIEEDFKNCPISNSQYDPYEMVAKFLGKHPGTVRKWSYSKKIGGQPIPLDCLNLLVMATETNRVTNFFRALSGRDLDEQTEMIGVYDAVSEMLGDSKNFIDSKKRELIKRRTPEILGDVDDEEENEPKIIKIRKGANDARADNQN